MGWVFGTGLQTLVKLHASQMEKLCSKSSSGFWPHLLLSALWQAGGWFKYLGPNCPPKDLAWVPGFWLWSCEVAAIVVILGVSQWSTVHSCSLSVYASHSAVPPLKIAPCSCNYHFAFLLSTKLYIFIWKSETERERERQHFHLLIHSQNGCNMQNWARLKLETRRFFQISYMGSWGQALEPIFADFSSTLAGSWIRVGSARTLPDAQIGCWYYRW